MDFFLARQHRDKLLDAAEAGLGALGLVDAEEDGVAVDAFEAVEEQLGDRVLREGGGKILGHFDIGLRGVGIGPLAVGLGVGDDLEALGLHAACGAEGLDFGDIDLGPDAARAARDEALHKGLGVPGPFLPVDPAVAERCVEGFLVGDRGDVAAFFGDLEPDARRAEVLLMQEGLPCQGVGEAHHGELVFGVKHGVEREKVCKNENLRQNRGAGAE